MKKLYAFVLMITVMSNVVAQTSHVQQIKNNNPYHQGSFYYITCKTSTPYLTLTSDNEGDIKDYLMKSVAELQSPGAGIELSYYKESPGGKHFTYQQTFNSIPVYGSTVKINLDMQQRVVNVMNACLPLNKINASQIQNQVALLKQSEFVNDFVISKYGVGCTYENEINICFSDDVNAVAVQQIKVSNSAIGLHEINLVDATGQLIFQKDMNTYFMPVAQDSVINIKVFNPDPLTTAHVSYGVPYKDYNDADSAVLNAQRFDTTITATYDSGTFKLINDFAKVVNFEAPNTGVVTQINPDFFYTRSASGFEDVNTFYHITTMQQYVQSLGFMNIMNQQLLIDSHGLSGADNSYFSGGGANPQIAFGEGGVDDAEDADVVVHEYGHALSWSANNNNFVSNDRGALDEAFGDYQAATYSRAIDTYHWYQVFTWDGYNEFWSGRPANGTKHYPTDIVGQVHADGEIWSAVMMEIWALVGKTTCDKLMYESLYGWSSNMTMHDAALLVIQADSALNGGANFFDLCDRFTARGLYTGACTSAAINELGTDANTIQFLNSNQFANGTGNLIIKLTSSEKNIIVNINDVTGRTIDALNYKGQNGFEISPKTLSNGVYFINVITPDNKATAKVLRVN